MIEIIHLKIIREIDKQKSMTAAAKTLCLTQPALSHSIKKLEQMFNIHIWEKKGRYLEFTPAGQHLLSLANRILPQIEYSEDYLKKYAHGDMGSLRIGMECHPCYQWLLKVISPYLKEWPGIDVDVKQKFKFGGIGALFNYEIDILITPDPLLKAGLCFEPVFNYEQVLVVPHDHPFRSLPYIKASQMASETLISYPVETNRLDIYSMFLTPHNISPKQHKIIESTDIILQMVENGRGVTALPHWFVEENKKRFNIASVRLGKHGIAKKLFIGIRKSDQQIKYLKAFIALSKKISFSFSTK